MPSPHRHAILLIEDHDDLREAVAGLLEVEGIEVRAVSGGANGLQALRAGFRPCLILLDVMMPQMTGTDFLIEMRRHPELAAIPVALFTGIANPRTLGALLGVAAVFPKPLLDPMEVVRFVKRQCAQPRESP
jgi:CheY-like chemotaxis protein